MKIWRAREDYRAAESLHMSSVGAMRWAEGVAAAPLKWVWDKHAQRWEACAWGKRFKVTEIEVHP